MERGELWKVPFKALCEAFCCVVVPWLPRITGLQRPKLVLLTLKSQLESTKRDSRQEDQQTSSLR